MNIELLKRLRTRFLRMRHPEHFSMEAIAAKTQCGSAMCIAGHALDLAGYKMRLRPDASHGGNIWIGRRDYDFFAPSGRKVKNALAAAARELGLMYRPNGGNRAYDLFHDFNLATPQQAAARIQELIDSAEKR